MSGLRLSISRAVLCLGALLVLNACGGGAGAASPVTTAPVPGTYTLTASALNPGSVVVGGSATSTITVTPVSGYTGTVSLSCSSITGGTPAPACSFSASPIVINGGTPGTSTLTVSAASGTAGGSYRITVTAVDAKNLAPSNGQQALGLTIPIPSYTLAATALNPGSIIEGGASTSTITVTPVSGYTGTVSLSCSSITGGTPAPACSFSVSPIVINGGTPGTSTLTVSAASGTAGGSYRITVTAVDAMNLAPSNGQQALDLAIPIPSYTLAATALNPGSIIVGGASTSTITVAPLNGYTGSVTPSCSSLIGGTPPPTCSFSPSPIVIGGATPGTSTLTVSSSSGTAGGSYAITLTARDATNLAPSHGPQALNLTIPTPSYTLTATGLNPASVSAGGTSTSTVTVTPANGYTGSVTPACSGISGSPAPTCSFSPSPIVIGGVTPGNSTLTVKTTGSATGGSFAFTVTGSDARNLGPSDGPQALALSTEGLIQHVVIIFQENRSTDNLFQDPVLIGAGADIASSGVNSLGQIIPLSLIGLGTNGANPDAYDLAHSHKSFGEMCDMNSSGQCAMDGADKIFVSCNPGAPNCPPPNAQFMYVDPADIQPYFQLAEQYTFADRMFQTNQGPSYPAHQFIISGTSAPAVGSNLFVMDNPHGIPLAGSDTGCTSPVNEYVEQIDPDGNQISTYPCFEHQTLMDLLDAANLTWRYYTPTAGSIWTAPNSIEHLCGPNLPPPNATECVAPEWTQNVILSPPGKTGQVLTDIANGQLPAVSWVIPQGMESDHGGSNDGSGPSWVASVVNAIGASPYCQNTAIFIAWDDWGGWYDHVAPPILNSYEYGFRVPLIVVSAYAQPAHISHVTHDFGSILKFTEGALNLPSLGYADASADDLSDCFNFSQTPLTFQTINAPLKADYFLHDTRPVTDPDND